jgi:hypothetical protein
MPEDRERRSSGFHCFRSGFKFYEHSANIPRIALLERKKRPLAGFGAVFGGNGRSPNARLFFRVENAGCVAADSFSVSGRTLAGDKTRFPCRDEEVCSGETPSRNRERVLRRGNLGFRVEISDSTLGRTLLGEKSPSFKPRRSFSIPRTGCAAGATRSRDGNRVLPVAQPLLRVEKRLWHVQRAAKLSEKGLRRKKMSFFSPRRTRAICAGVFFSPGRGCAAGASLSPFREGVAPLAAADLETKKELCRWQVLFFARNSSVAAGEVFFFVRRSGAAAGASFFWSG